MSLTEIYYRKEGGNVVATATQTSGINDEYIDYLYEDETRTPDWIKNFYESTAIPSQEIEIEIVPCYGVFPQEESEIPLLKLKKSICYRGHSDPDGIKWKRVSRKAFNDEIRRLAGV